MKWHLYKEDDPNTWPQIDCQLLVYFPKSERFSLDCIWDSEDHFLMDRYGLIDFECYYAYIGYAPSGYKTLYPTKCMRENDGRCAYEDDGYCMDYDNEYACGCKNEIAEYKIEMKEIWKEFE